MLVSNLEVLAANRPRLYRASVVAVSSLLYGLLLLILAVQAVLLAWIAGEIRQAPNPLYALGLLSLAFPLASVLFVAVRALAVPIPPVRGVTLKRKDAPKLFKLLTWIRRKLDAPELHRVVITMDFNASIQQVPRFGLFGGYRNHLVIGLPLAHALTGAELAAVLAHEYSHLSESHGKLDGWIHRQRRAFAALLKHASKRSRKDLGNTLLFPVLQAFAPWYNAFTFVLSRRNEYRADALAASIVGEQNMVDGLIRARLAGRWVQECFWPRLYRQADQNRKPPFMPFTALPTALRSELDEWWNRDGLHEALEADAGLLDSHPSLRERAQALDHRFVYPLPEPVSLTAAEKLLGPLSKRLARHFDKVWWAAVEDSWRRHSSKMERERERLAELAARPLAGLPPHEMQEYATLLLGQDDRDEAKAVLEYLLRHATEDYPVPMATYGQLLLEDGDPAGLEYLEKAALASPGLAEECLNIGGDWLMAHRGEAEARQWRDRLAQMPSSPAAG